MGPTLPSSQAESLQDFIWRTRYRDPDAWPVERSIGDTWRRVARSVAAMESDPVLWQRRFLSVLEGFRFLPGGRILAGAGVSRQVTLANCFVMGRIEDSIGGIFEALKEGALTLQQGGGVGYDFSTLRPRGALAGTTGMIASGPVSFLHVWDAMCATVLSTGVRRGAMMATLRCDHPDIEEFIAVKSDPRVLTRFNLSVLVTDALLRAVDEDAPWPLVFPRGGNGCGPGGSRSAVQQSIDRAWSGTAGPVTCDVLRTVGARALWKRICTQARDWAEPGVLFIDRINAENNLGYAEQISASNPCAEEPLPAYGACNLGSLNLPAFINAPLQGGAHMDLQALSDVAHTAVRFLDNVIEISRFPLPQQRREALATRRIGLGITGLADALAMLGVRYDSDVGRDLAIAWVQAIRDAAYESSVELARDRGAFERFDAQRYCERPFIRRLPEALQYRIGSSGIRNSHLLAIAPAGTISLLAGNVSSGIEPIRALTGRRGVLDAAGTLREFAVTDFAYGCWRSYNPSAKQVPAAFSEPASVGWLDQLRMQAALQPLIDGAISKTVALPADTAADAVDSIFRAAFDLGLKGCTVFRDTSRPAVLASAAEAQQCGPQAHCCDIGREAD